VHPIADSQEAARCINQQRFDGIFFDIGMPILNGLDLAKLVRESRVNKTTPIVIVTGKQEQDVMHSSFSCRGHLLPSQAHRQR
jgi:CheY-like chemotaxis protein